MQGRLAPALFFQVTGSRGRERSRGSNMVKRGVISTVLAVLAIGGFAGSGPSRPATDEGVPLGTVLEEYGCLMPSVQAAGLDESWPEAWNTLRMVGGDVSPARLVRDPWPTFHSVAVDPINNRVVFTDSNRHGIWSYDRTAGSLTSIEPERPISGVRGPATGMMFVASVAVDPARREIYSVDNDIGDRLMAFSYDQTGNARPIRSLHVPHQAWGIGLSDKRDEVAISVENARTIVVYKRGAKDEDKPIRRLRGLKTGLGDPHGVQFDDLHGELVVVNHGNQSWRPRDEESAMPLGGRWNPPSITTFNADANGNTAPLRTIVGEQTQLDWPMGVSLDVERGEMAVANNGDSSILVFKRDASGNTAPIRVIKGGKTGIVGPMNVAFDTKNGELWVSNYGDHTGLVFARDASGNVAPKRILRNAPAGAPTSGFGNPGAVAYDTKRGEIIVPN